MLWVESRHVDTTMGVFDIAFRRFWPPAQIHEQIKLRRWTLKVSYYPLRREHISHILTSRASVSVFVSGVSEHQLKSSTFKSSRTVSSVRFR